MEQNNPFDGMQVFCAVVEAGGFSAAARQLGHSVSHVSKVVARLETKLRTRLLNRTTRRVSLTELGNTYYDQARQILRDAETVRDRIQNTGVRPVGLLRISIPVMFSQAHLQYWLPDFLQRYPDVSVEIEESDRMVDIVGEGFDAVIRAGPLKDAGLIARSLLQTRQMIVAAPSYLKQHGTPQHPRDLRDHTLIDFSYRATSNSWEFVGENGRPMNVAATPRIRCNSAEMEAALAVAGVGITGLPHMACQRQVASGALVPILEPFEQPPIALQVVYPSRAYLAPKVRAFVDFLGEKCQSL